MIAAGDHLGTLNTWSHRVADTFNHADDMEALSIREAVDLGEPGGGSARNLGTSLAIHAHARSRDECHGHRRVVWRSGREEKYRGAGRRGPHDVDWKTGVVDEVFDLLGDANVEGQADFGSVSAADYTIWQDQEGSVGAWGQFSADADDDGDVDSSDYAIWSANYGHTLQLFDVSL